MNSSHRRALFSAPSLILLLGLSPGIVACGDSACLEQGSSEYAAAEQAGSLVITLDANSSTGYTWCYELSSVGIVEVTRSEYVAGEHDSVEAGYGGTQVYELAAVDDGVVAMRLDYARGADEVLESELRVFQVSDGLVTEVTEPLEVDSFEYHHVGMSMEDAFCYRAQRDGDSCAVTVDYDCLGLYLESAAALSFMDELGRIAAACDLESWDGFSETDGDVLEGEGFQLEVTLSDGTTIRAKGRNAFPDGYRSFASMLDLLYQPSVEQLRAEGE